MTSTPTTPVGTERHCGVCRAPRAGWFDPSVVPTCERCKTPVPHYSTNQCRSGGMRPHRGCTGRAHCTCDGCF